MVTKLELFNGSLGHLGPVRLNSVTENRSDRRELDAVYDKTNRYMLERGIWRFALRTQRWDADTNIEPAFGRAYAFSRPTDYAGHLHHICVDERQEIEDESFTDENGYWYSDSNILYVTFVSNDVAYGMDLGKWPQLFCDAWEAEAAYRSGLPITKDGQSKSNLNQLRLQLLDTAKRNHAIDERVKYKPTGSWVRTRFYRASRSQRRERTI